MERRDKRFKKENKIDKILEIPKEVYSNEPKITVIGFNKMLIENYKTILDYQDFYIRINTYIGIVNVNGFNLILNEMTQDNIIIEGKIESIDFESTVDEVGE